MQKNNKLLPIVSSRNYFEEFINFFVCEKKVTTLINFINSHDISFTFYKTFYDVNKLFESYIEKINTLANSDKNYNLSLFEREENIIDIYQKSLNDGSFEVAGFFTCIIMQAKAKNPTNQPATESTRKTLFNNSIVKAWIDKNHDTIHQEIINDCR